MFIKVALDAFAAGAIVCLRAALGGLLLLSRRLARRARRHPRPRALGSSSRFVQVVVPFLLITYGENHISSSLTAILISSVADLHRAARAALRPRRASAAGRSSAS